MRPTFTAHETSLSKLDDHEWQILSNRWARGIDWCVRKVGRRKWDATITPGFPLFTTKKAAYEAATKLLLAESRWRCYKRVTAMDCPDCGAFPGNNHEPVCPKLWNGSPR